MHKRIIEITKRITERSKASRDAYLNEVDKMFEEGVYRSTLSCGNLAHSFAGCNSNEKAELSGNTTKNLGLVTAYNDMLSAHRVYENYPEQLRSYAQKFNAVLQVAGGVPAMCDGVTQGKDGMELSLFSRDVIALSTSVGLSHNVFDAVLCLGICDKIVPGLMMGCLNYGHLPVVFVPGGPMPSGIQPQAAYATAKFPLVFHATLHVVAAFASTAIVCCGTRPAWAIGGRDRSISPTCSGFSCTRRLLRLARPTPQGCSVCR